MVFEMIFLLREIGAKETVFTTLKICRKHAIVTIFAKRDKAASGAAVHTEALIAELAVIHVGGVCDVVAVLVELPVVAIDAVLGRINKIAVFAVARAGRVITIFIGDRDDSHMGDHLAQARKLLEKRLVQIHIAPERGGIESVRIPLLLRVDFVGAAPKRFRGIDGNDAFPRLG